MIYTKYNICYLPKPKHTRAIVEPTACYVEYSLFCCAPLL